MTATPTTVETTTSVDLLVVGAGPAGLFAAYYAGVRGLSTAVVDSLSEPGGQVAAMYPEKQIYDVGGFPAVTGRQLVDNLVAQAAQYHPTYLLGQAAETLSSVPPEGDEGPAELVVTTSAGRTVRARAIVITGGIGTFTPRQLPAGEEHLGRGMEYFVPSIAEYAGQDVVVVGGGDSAVDWALMLRGVARSVTLVHRRKQFRAHAASVSALEASEVEIVRDGQVTATLGETVLQAVEVSVTGEDEPRRVPCQRLVAALGFVASIGPLAEWGVELEDRRHVRVDTRMATNLPGVFAAGDITEYPGKVRLIAVGFGEAATAVNNAAVHIDPAAHVFPGHTSNQAPPVGAAPVVTAGPTVTP